MRELCGLLGYSSQAYYQYNRQTEKRTFRYEAYIQQVLAHRRLHPRLGTKKLFELIRPDMGRDAFFELLRDYGLLVLGNGIGRGLLFRFTASGNILI